MSPEGEIFLTLRYRGEDMRYLLKFSKTIGAINEWTGRTVSFLVLLLSLVVVYTVVARYLFHKAPLWGLESSEYLFTLVVMLMGGYVLLYDGHVKNDIFYNRLSPMRMALLDLFTSAFFFLFVGSLLWKGVSFFWTSWTIRETTGSLWNPPVYPIKGLTLIGFLLFTLQGVAKFIRDLTTVLAGGEKR